jgi:hypothetical protein
LDAPDLGLVWLRKCEVFVEVRSGGLELGVELWERVDLFSGFLLGNANLIKGLQVEPELGTGAEEVDEAQGCVSALSSF